MKELHRWLTTDRWLGALLWACLGMTGVALMGLLLDARVLDEAPVWLKPLKFSVSIGLYGLTLGWLVGRLPHSLWVRLAVRGQALLLLIELVLISLQAARGVPSHFNISTLFDGIIFTIMGVAIGLSMILALMMAGIALRAPQLTPGFRLAVVGGLMLSAVAGFSGYLMPTPTPAQLHDLRAGCPSRVGSHFNGPHVPNSGLPLVGWSRTAGDWRVGHFIGLHGLQLLLISAWGVRRRPLHLQLSLLVPLTVAVWLLFGWAIWRAATAQPLLW